MTTPIPAPHRPVLESNISLGIALMLGAVALFSFLDASVKYAGNTLGLAVAVVVWIRFAGHTALNIVLLGPSRSLTALRSANRPWLQMVRSLFMLGATGFNFWAVQYLRLDQTVTIFFLTPLIVAALAGPILGEWVGWRRLTAILVGLAGVLLVLRPGFGGVHWAIILSFGATASYALYSLTTRYLAAHDSTETTQIFTPLSGLVLTAPLALVFWETPPDVWSWIVLLSLGISGGLGHLLLIKAHRLAPAPTLSPFIYSGLLWMTLLGYLLFGDTPDAWTLAGGIVVIGSGLYLFARERALESDNSRNT